MAIISAFAVFSSLMVVFAPAALAHHPEISANQTCVDQRVAIAYQAVSWKTDGTPGSGHPNIVIEVRVNGAGTWAQVDSGAFNAGNNYRFSDTFDASPYWGDSIEVRARAIGPWDNGIGGGESRVTSPFLVTEDCFNPSCPDQYLEYKVEPVSAGLHGTYFTVANIQDGGSGPTFDWSSTVPVFQVIVKGGPGANIYDYPGGDTSDAGLHAPLNPKNNKWYGLSHITFCYGEPEPEPVDVTPNPQLCEVVQGVPQGAISFNIDPASGATVQVYSDAAMTVEVGGPLGDEEALGLPPGTYHWRATAANVDFELSGPSTGQFTIAPCDASVTVGAGPCLLEGGVPVGLVQVVIDPDSGATVVISGPGGPHNFSGTGGTAQLAPGSYSWQATASGGFALTGSSSGRFEIPPCSASTVVVSGECAVNDNDTPLGLVEVTIDPDSGATVVITGPGGPYEFSGTGGSQELAPGSYSWTASAGGGFELTGETSGQFSIAPCDASVTVTSGVCELLEGPLGVVEIDIDPDTAATVTIYSDPGMSNVVASFDDEASTALPPGTYYWSATANAGFTLDGETSGQFTIEPCASTVLVASGDCFLDEAGVPVGLVEVTIDPDSGAIVVITGPGGPYQFSGTGGSQELAPGSYSWTASAGSGFELTGVTSGEFTIAPCEASVVVADGDCEVTEAGPRGSVTVFIDAASGATVTVYDEDLDVAAQFVGTGGSSSLPPGAYIWEAVPGDGFQFPEGQATSGQFVIEPCVGTVAVSHGNCVVGSASAFGSVSVTIDPDSAAVVSVINSNGQVVATFTESGGSQSLVAGEYTWVVDASAGFSVSGASSGGFTVVACPDEVEGEEVEPDEVGDLDVLPFTGMDTRGLFGSAIVLLGTGWVLIRTARRREEG
jgi:hypothetical protein